MTPLEESRNNRILVIDDNPSIHEDIRKILCTTNSRKAASNLQEISAVLFDETQESPQWHEFEVDSAYQGEEGLRKVQESLQASRPYALAFVDIRMPPGWDGIETITRIWKEYPALQVVICTAYSDYSWEQMIRQLGKSDNLVILKKPFDNIEVLQLAHALTEKWLLGHQVKCRLQDLDRLVAERTAELSETNEKLSAEIVERMQMEKALRLSEERFAKAFKSSPIPLVIQSLPSGQFVDANQGFLLLSGFTRDQLVGCTPDQLKIWSDSEESNAILHKLHGHMSIRNMHSRLRMKSGQIREVLLSAELFELNNDPFVLLLAQDISEQINLENQLRQSQKMEAIGQLAAGVAHDFNNILTVIQGHASELLNDKPEDSAEHKPLQTIVESAKRAGKLVRQLLTFSRKQFIQVRPMDVATALQAVGEMLPRVLGEQIHLNIPPITQPLIMSADSGMVEQMLMNLALNARDAMPAGGILAISAQAVQITPENLPANQDAYPGKFVRLTVKDTGCGMSQEVLSHLFEPFFTTKPVGKGTGLGLATVYGIVKQHKGWIDIQSVPGQGTTCNVYLPATDQKVEAPDQTIPKKLRRGKETILVVEDEDIVRDFVSQVLRSNGYSVISSTSGAKALEDWLDRRNEIDLLLTDMVMPDGVLGRELAERFTQGHPDLAVIYTSGYSPGMAGKDLEVFEERNFLAKPYAPSKLLELVGDCLERRNRNN